jgi:hypothetical protein
MQTREHAPTPYPCAASHYRLLVESTKEIEGVLTMYLIFMQTILLDSLFVILICNGTIFGERG